MILLVFVTINFNVKTLCLLKPQPKTFIFKLKKKAFELRSMLMHNNF